MHLFQAKAQAQAKAKIEPIIELLNLDEEPNLLDNYKAIFAKSFFNVVEKPMTDKDKELYQQFNELEGYKITPVGELDYSQAKIPNTQEEYSQAYARARKAVLKEVNKNYRELGDDSMSKEAKLNEAKLALSSENLVINDIKLFDQELGNSLANFSNVDKFQGSDARRANSKIEEGVHSKVANQAAILSKRISNLQSPENEVIIEDLGLAEVVQYLSDRTDSINQRLVTQGRAPDGGNKAQRGGETPSPSPT